MAGVNSDATTNAAPESTAAGGGDGSVITSLTLEQTVLAVFRPRPHLPSAVSPNKPRGLGGKGTPESVTIKAIPEGEGWSIASLLLPLESAPSDAERAEMLRLGGCPVAARSAIHVVGGKVGSGGSVGEAPASDVLSRLLPPPLAAGSNESTSESEEEATESRSSSMSDFLQEKLWEVVGDGTAGQDDAVAATAGVSSTTAAVARLDHYLSGRGGTRGVSVANLVNMHPTSGAFVDFLQPVPYFMEPLLGTLRARVVPSSLSSSGSTSAAVPGLESAAAAAGPLVSLARNLTLTPGEGRRPAVVEARLWVPPKSAVVLGFDFFKRFLTVDDFPPDPSRGFDVPPPLARFSFAERSVESATCEGPGGGGEGRDRSTGGGACLPEEGADGGAGGGRVVVVYAYGEAGLLDTPQPDFSMPFNVITFTSTVITFFLGTAINLLVRKSRKKAKKKKDDAADSDQSGGRAGGRADGRHSLLDRSRQALSRAFGGIFGRNGGQAGTGRRIRKEVGRLKGD